RSGRRASDDVLRTDDSVLRTDDSVLRADDGVLRPGHNNLLRRHSRGRAGRWPARRGRQLALWHMAAVRCRPARPQHAAVLRALVKADFQSVFRETDCKSVLLSYRSTLDDRTTVSLRASSRCTTSRVLRVTRSVIVRSAPSAAGSRKANSVARHNSWMRIARSSSSKLSSPILYFTTAPARFSIS